ncbi:cobalamin 5'-phosphate synthase [Desulfuribacillus alkaliarsenatis]|uniref:Adenosylcobinamide-GDP ribazoletransferase n=1 Tax=Desulfuribacillus alkaliarsenatis TaxID=766136 RepID=A0A1E5G4K6_9FIRM|nr:cobalamin 5'-phosphate synthase [Desulfuribacillus alkaliarsenatis]
MRLFLLAVSFLTIIPARSNHIATEREMAESLRYYPIVGILIGLILAATAYLANALGLGLGGDALIIVLWLILHGGLHADGLMDTADGVFSGKERSKVLEIMRDSRVGAMGVLVFVANVLLKFAFLASLPVNIKMWALLLAPVLGRAMIVYAIKYYPYARSGSGLGKSYGSYVTTNIVIVAMITVVAVSVLASPVASLFGMLIILLAATAAALFVHWIAGKLGGHTGDTYGATCEVSETLLIIFAVMGLKGFYG